MVTPPPSTPTTPLRTTAQPPTDRKSDQSERMSTEGKSSTGAAAARSFVGGTEAAELDLSHASDSTHVRRR